VAVLPVNRISFKRDNVLFGQPFDSDRYWGIMETACLLPDLQLLADGDLTEVLAEIEPHYVMLNI
jgi:hypothetical protein